MNMAVADESSSADGLPCPLCGDYTGSRASVEAHISGSRDETHRGEVGRNYREEIEAGVAKIEEGADEIVTEIEDESSEQLLDVVQDLGQEMIDEADEMMGEESEEDADQDDADEGDQEDGGRAAAAREDAKPGVGEAAAASGAAALGSGAMLWPDLSDSTKKYVLYGGALVLLGLLAYALLASGDGQQPTPAPQEENQNQNQPQNGGLAGGNGFDATQF